MTTFRMSGLLDAGAHQEQTPRQAGPLPVPQRAQLKGYVIVLNALTADEEDVADALLGQSGVQLTRESGGYKAESTREANGVIADVLRGKLLLDEVDFVVALTGRKARPPKVAAVFVNEDRGRVTSDEVEALSGSALARRLSQSQAEVDTSPTR